MNSDTILVIGSFDCNDHTNTILESVKLSVGQPQWSELGGPDVDIASQVGIDDSALVESVFGVRISGSDGDDLEARLNSLRAELAKETNTAAFGLKGRSSMVEMRLRRNQRIDAVLDPHYVSSAVARIEVRVEREPWLYSPTDTLYSASALSLPAVLDLSFLGGLHKAPLDIVLTAATADLHQVVMGVYPEESITIADFIHEAVDLTWSAGAADTEAAGYPDGTGNTVWKTNSATAAYAAIDVTSYQPGTYAVFANAKKDSGADPAVVYTEYGDEVTIEGTTLRRHFLGFVSLPCETVRGSATSSLTVYLDSDGTDYVYLNTIELIPASWGFVGWHHSTSTESADELRWSDELVYADDVASLAYQVDGADRQLKALGGTLVVTGEAETAAATLAVSADVTYEPRWEQLPGAVISTFDDLVLAGEAEIVTPSTDTGYAEYTSLGRYFLPASTNLITNPRLVDANDDDIPDLWAIGSTITGTPTYSIIDRGDGKYAMRIQYTGVAGDSAGNLTLYSWLQTASGTVDPSDPLTAQAYLSGSLSGCYVRISVITRQSGGTVVDSVAGDSIETLTSEPTLYSTSVPSAGALTSKADVRVYFGGIGEGDTIDVTWEMPKLSKSAIADLYFDGSNDGCSWSGTADASSSVRPVSLVEYADDNDGAGFTLAYRITPTFAADVGANRFAAYLYDGADYKTRVLLGSTGRWATIATDGSDTATAQSDVQTFEAETTHDVVHRVSWGGYADVRSDGTDATSADADAVAAPALDKLAIPGPLDGYERLQHVIYSHDIKDAAWMDALDADTAARQQPLRLFRDHMDTGDVIYPFVDNSWGYRKLDPDARTLTPGLMVFDGDSLSADNLSIKYPYKLMDLLGTSWTWDSVAVVGQGSAAMLADADTEVDVLYDSTQANNVLSVWIGANDGTALGTYTYDNLRAYCLGRKAAGFTILVCTVTPRTDAAVTPEWLAGRPVYNQLLRDHYTEFADAIADFAADHRIGDDGDSDDTTYYNEDKVHLSEAGYEVVAEIAKEALDGLA